MLLVDYTSIIAEDFPDYNKQFTWNLLHAYIDAHIQNIIDYYSGGGSKSITRLQSKFASIVYPDNSRYNILFQQIIHRGGELEIKYINIFQITKAMKNSV